MKREYILTLKLDGGAKSTQSPIAGDSTGGEKETSQGLLSKEGAKAFGVGFAAYKTVKSFATQIVNYQVSTVSLRTGSNELQEKANFINEVSQKGIGVLETIGAGALLGGLPGAIVGLGLGLIHTAVGYSQKADLLNKQAALEMETIQRNYIRAGAMGSRHE